MSVRNSWLCIAAAICLGFCSSATADDLEMLPPELSQEIAKQLAEKFEKEHADRQIKFEVDPTKATGVHSGSDGLLLVPVKGLKDGDIDPAVETECGAGLCYLFVSKCYAPLVNGQEADFNKLPSVKFSGPDGNDGEAICLLLTVKHVDGDDWRLFAFGKEKEPLIKASFAEATDSAENPLSLKVKGVKDQKADLAVTLFSKYSASFPIQHK